MRKLALILAGASFSLMMGGTSVAGQDHQQEVGEGQCPISSAELCYTKDGVRTCTKEVVYVPCDGGGNGGGTGGGDTGGGDTGGTPGGGGGTGPSGPNP